VESYTGGPIHVEWMHLKIPVSPFQIRWVQVTDENENAHSTQTWMRHDVKPGRYQVM